MYLTEMTLDEVAKLLSDLGEPRYRAKQVYAWLVRGVLPAEMTNLPKTLREKLARKGILENFLIPEDGELLRF